MSAAVIAVEHKRACISATVLTTSPLYVGKWQPPSHALAWLTPLLFPPSIVVVQFLWRLLGSIVGAGILFVAAETGMEKLCAISPVPADPSDKSWNGNVQRGNDTQWAT